MVQENTYDFKSLDTKLQYQLLDGLRQDCDYFIRMKAENPEVKDCSRVLYYGDAQKQIEAMRELWNVIEEKPAWLTMEQIDVYAGKMGVELTQVESMERQDKNAHSILNLSESEKQNGSIASEPANPHIDQNRDLDSAVEGSEITLGDLKLLQSLPNEFNKYCNSIKDEIKLTNSNAKLLPEPLYQIYLIHLRKNEDAYNETFADRIDYKEVKRLQKQSKDAYDETFVKLVKGLEDTVTELKQNRELMENVAKSADDMSLRGYAKFIIFKIDRTEAQANLERWKSEYVEQFKNTEYYDFLNSMVVPNNYISGCGDLLPLRNREDFYRYFDAADELNSMHPSLCCEEDIEEQRSKVKAFAVIFKTGLKKDLEEVINKNMVKKNSEDTAVQSKEKGSRLTQYMQSLQYPDDFLSGDMSLLPEENYDQYVKHIRAIQEYENLDPDDFFIDPTFPPEEQNYTFFEASQDSLSKVMQTEDEFVSQLKQSLSSLNLISIDNSIDNKVETSNHSVADSSKSKDEQKFADYMKSLEFPNDLTSGNPALLPWQIRGLLEDYLCDEKEWDNTEYPEMSWYSYNAFRSSFKRVAFKELNTSFVNDMKIDLEKLKPSLSDTKSIRASIDAKLNKLSNSNILDVKLPLIFLANNGNKLYVSQIYETDRYDLIAKINGQTLKLDRLDYIPIQDKSVQEIIVKGFGEQLGLKEHYQQFVLPEVYGISHDDIRIECDLESNYQIIISRPSENIIAAPLSKNDADAIHNDIATIEQLAAKYLYNNRFTLVEQQIQQVMEPEATYGKTVKQSTKNNKNMAKKKTDNPLPEEKKEVKVKKESTSKTTVSEEVSTVKSETANDVKTDVVEKRAPQLVTVNGDKITHAHCFQSNKSDDWFYTAKINGTPLKAMPISKEDAEAVLNKKATVEEMMNRYFPTKLAPKVSPAEFKMPRNMKTSEGEFRLEKFNVYKETDEKNVDYGKYRFFANVENKKMSCLATKEDLNGYFDRTTTPEKLIVKNFGDRLGIKEYYEQFNVPECVTLENKNILVAKNQSTNRYEIQAQIPGVGETAKKELSYDDRQAFFNNTATKPQLAGKYLSDEITMLALNALSQNNAMKNEIKSTEKTGLSR